MKRGAYSRLLALVTDRDLVFEFFAVFSRFEYALKRAGFLRQKDKAEPDWSKFSESIRGRLLPVKDTAFQAARKYLLADPPKTQVIVADQLGWQDTVKGTGETDERYLLRLVATVRNNLFHGGKYPYPFGPVSDAARNRQLLESSIAVLECCLRLSPEVNLVFADVA